MDKKTATERFLEKASEELQAEVKGLFDRAKGSEGWAILQQGFLEMVNGYVEKELTKPPAHDVDNHEAGGQWRIGFPHQALYGDSRISEYMNGVMNARKEYNEANLYHGFSDCAEVHHQIETFIYFQIPLFYWELAGSELALEAIEDLAHHMGNWEEGVPDWYDWDKHLFVSSWLGTREVRDYPPYDYQEANHFRWIDAVMAAYLGTGKERYLDLMVDYSNRWCDHIEALSRDGKPIQCSILPEGANVTEMGHAGSRKDSDDKVYKVFYAGVSDNTSYDVAGALLDLYRVTANSRYLEAARMIMDQFFENGANGRPAMGYRMKESEWSIVDPEKSDTEWGVTTCNFQARLALRHDIMTGEARYRQRIIDWASSINEELYMRDQMNSSVMVAAHYYDSDPRWLEKAYAMALRTYAAVESNDKWGQCNWHRGRQGTKFVMELLYQPLLGGAEWGTRGSIPLTRLEHQTPQRQGLPEDVALRIWRIDDRTEGFEAINLSQRPVSWCIKDASAEQDLVRIENMDKPVENGKLEIAANEKISGRLIWTPVGASMKPKK